MRVGTITGLAGRLGAATLLTLILSGCAGTLETLDAAAAYERAALPESRIQLDLAYRAEPVPGADPDKHRLDLFLPDPPPGQGREGFTTLVFLHGGGWTHGDRALGLFGIQPLRNLGRFYAARGYGVVVPSYRLQPGASWREQLDDVAAAVAWTRREIGRHGGDPDAVLLGGHSAGAWLAAWVGLSDAPLARQGVDRSMLCGLVLVSGAAYDLEDEETWALGVSREYMEARFDDGEEGWPRRASILSNLDAPVPPALVMAAAEERASFHRQADLLHGAIESAAPGSRRLTMPDQNHQRILVAMSREADPVSEAVLDFMGERDCAGEAGAR